MIIPVRCFSCLRCIAQDYEKYQELIKTETPEKVLNDLGYDRYCCRRMFLSHVDILDTVLRY